MQGSVDIHYYGTYATVKFTRFKETEDFQTTLDWFKIQIPFYLRRWEPEEKNWEVYPDAYIHLEKLCEGFQDEGLFVEREYHKPTEPEEEFKRDFRDAWQTVGVKKKPSQILKVTKYHRILGVLPDAHPMVIKMAYRTLAKIYHPDVEGGSKEKMQELNLAWEKVKEE